MLKLDRKARVLDVSRLIKPYGGKESVARHLVFNRHMSLKRVEARMKTAENVGLIKRGGEGRGVVYVGLAEPLFLDKLHNAQVGLTDKQRIAFSFLSDILVPQEIALKLCKTQMASRDLFLKRAKVIAGMKLDSKKYGVERIPVNLFWKLIHFPPTKIRRYVGRVLFELENTHSSKVLDEVFPVWRRIKQISPIEPRTILSKVEWLIANGVSLHGRYIRQYSLEELNKVKNDLQLMTSAQKTIFQERLAKARKSK